MSIVPLDCRAGLRCFAPHSFDACIADPPYGDTSLPWDQIVPGWLAETARVMKPAASIWVFGSMRFLAPVFAEMETLGFRYSQDIVWEKQNGSGFHVDRFRRVHEHAVMFYRGAWAEVHHETQRDGTFNTHGTLRRATSPVHYGAAAADHEVPGGRERLMRSVLKVRNEHRRAIHPTQKPLDLLQPLVRYSVPPGGTLLVPFAGSGSEVLAARIEGRNAIGFEIDPEMAAKAQARIDSYVTNPIHSAP